MSAALLATVFLVPIDSIKLPIPLPVDARPDRIVIGAFVVLAIAAKILVPRTSTLGGHRYGPIDLAILAFVAVAVLSVAFNLPGLSVLNELDETTRKFASLLSFAAFYLFLTNTVRTTEIQAFVRLLVGLATIAAVGTTFQYLTHINPFFYVSLKLAPPGTSVASYVTDLTSGRPDITGPTRHGLATSTMLAMAFPFAIVCAVGAGRRLERNLCTVATVLILIGCVTTLRRSGVVLPICSGAVVLAFGGRRMLPFAAGLLAAVVVLAVVFPSTVSQVTNLFSSSNVVTKRSSDARTDDYKAIRPDVEAHALIGRGYESYNAKRYRFIDNEYLQMLIGAGSLGVACYVLLILTGAGSAVRLARQIRGSPQGALAVACVGSIAAFAVASALFDAMSFPQAPYALFSVLAIIAVMRRAPAPSVIASPR